MRGAGGVSVDAREILVPCRRAPSRELRPTLEAITQRVNGDNLARMRRVKGRLLRAVNKIAAVRSEARRRLGAHCGGSNLLALFVCLR